MMENLQFIQSFRHKEIGPLLSELLEDIDDQQMAENGTADAVSMTSSESDVRELDSDWGNHFNYFVAINAPFPIN
jgi:hypothetical protein